MTKLFAYLRTALTEFISLVCIIAFLSAVMVWVLAVQLMLKPGCGFGSREGFRGSSTGLGHHSVGS